MRIFRVYTLNLVDRIAAAALPVWTRKPMLASCLAGLPLAGCIGASVHVSVSVEHGAGRPEDALVSSSMRVAIEG